jgi:hypothetical protein
MNENIFRKKSLERVSSPEQLTDYIKVSNPSVWAVLIAVAVLLMSALIWSVFGKLPDTLRVSTILQNGSAVCYVDSETAAKLKGGMAVKLGNATGTITEISNSPISGAELSDKYKNEYTTRKLTAGQWNYPVKVKVLGLPDGIYEMAVTIDSVKPISFIWN